MPRGRKQRGGRSSYHQYGGKLSKGTPKNVGYTGPSDLISTSGSYNEQPDQAPVNMKLHEIQLPQLDLYAMPPLQTQIIHTFEEKIGTQQNQADADVLNFNIYGNDHWLDLTRAELILELEVRMRDETVKGNSLNGDGNIDNDVPIAYPESNLFHDLWERIDCSINGTDIRTHVGNLPILAYVDTLLNADEKEQEYLGESQMFFKQPIPLVTEITNAMRANINVIPKGLRERVNFFTRPTTNVTLRGRPCHMVFKLDKCIPPNTNVFFKFSRASEKCYWKNGSAAGDETEPAQKIVIRNAHIQYKRYVLHPDVHGRLLRQWTAAPFKYPIMQRPEVKNHNIPAGYSRYTSQALFNDVSPIKVHLCFIRSADYAGAFSRSIYHFTHCNLTELFFTKNGVSYPPLKYKELSLGTNDVKITNKAFAPYSILKRSAAEQFIPKILNITYEEFCSGLYSIFEFDFSNEQNVDASSGVFNTSNPAPISLDMVFRNPLATPVNMIVISYYNSAIQLYDDKKVGFNWI